MDKGWDRKVEMNGSHIHSFVSIVALVLASFSTAATARPVDAIYGARAASNAAIAEHDAEGAVRALAPEALIFASGGTLISGKAAMRAAFSAVFADARFKTLIRRPTRIELGMAVGAETGVWTGRWTNHVVTGTYLARWNYGVGGWQISTESFVPISCRGPGC